MVFAITKQQKRRKLRRIVSDAYLHGQEVVWYPDQVRDQRPIPGAHRALVHAFLRGERRERRQRPYE